MTFIEENYIWIIVGGVLILMAIIGYFAEKTNFGRSKDGEPKKKKQPKKKKVKKEPKKIEKKQEEVEKIEGVTIDDKDWLEPINEVKLDELETEDLFVPLDGKKQTEDIFADLTDLENYNDPIIEKPTDDIVIDDVVEDDNLINKLNEEQLPKIDELDKQTEDIWKF